MVFSRKFRRFYFFEQYISSRFFENEPNEICSHFSEKGPKAAIFYFAPEKLQNHAGEGKGKEKKKERKEEK